MSDRPSRSSTKRPAKAPPKKRPAKAPPKKRPAKTSEGQSPMLLMLSTFSNVMGLWMAHENGARRRQERAILLAAMAFSSGKDPAALQQDLDAFLALLDATTALATFDQALAADSGDDPRWTALGAVLRQLVPTGDASAA